MRPHERKLPAPFPSHKYGQDDAVENKPAAKRGQADDCNATHADPSPLTSLRWHRVVDKFLSQGAVLRPTSPPRSGDTSCQIGLGRDRHVEHVHGAPGCRRADRRARIHRARLFDLFEVALANRTRRVALIEGVCLCWRLPCFAIPETSSRYPLSGK
jgi:hypothetical protein